MSWLSKAGKKASGVVGGVGSLLFGGGPGNPYDKPGAPNLSFLRDPSAFQFLRTPTDLTGGFKNYYDFYRAPESRAPNYFGQAVSAYNAPSSVDAVRSELNNERTAALLDQIGRDTNQGVATAARGYYDRNLIQPGAGVSSDISAIGLQAAADEGGRRAADVRTAANLADVERLAKREADLRALYGTQYQAGVAEDTQGRALAANAANLNQAQYLDLFRSGADITNRNAALYADILAGRDTAYAGGLNDIYRTASDNYNTGMELKNRYRRPGLFENITTNFGTSFGSSAGNSLGKGVGMFFGGS